MEFTIIILLIGWCATSYIQVKMMNEQQELINSFLNDNLDFIKSTIELINKMNDSLRMALKTVETKTSRIEEIIENTKVTNGNYKEALDKIEKALLD